LNSYFDPSLLVFIKPASFKSLFLNLNPTSPQTLSPEALAFNYIILFSTLIFYTLVFLVVPKIFTVSPEPPILITLLSGFVLLPILITRALSPISNYLLTSSSLQSNLFNFNFVIESLAVFLIKYL